MLVSKGKGTIIACKLNAGNTDVPSNLVKKKKRKTVVVYNFNVYRSTVTTIGKSDLQDLL